MAAPYFAVAKDQKKDKKAKDSHSDQKAALKGLPAIDLSEDDAIVHALNRLGYGPRPGDIARVKQMGLAVWIDQQLHPESISDAALDARLEKFPTLTMSSSKLLQEFPQPKQAAKQEGMTVEEYRKQQQEQLKTLRQQGEAAQPNAMPAAGDGQDGAAGINNGSVNNGNGAGPGAAGPANAMMDYAKVRTPQRVVAELSMAKLDRAIYSERQLYEEMVDFWFNHFNVFAGKGADRWLLTSYERDAIRPHAMGKFRDLLGATAQSPAMLFYLDNWQSADPEASARMQQQAQQRRGQLPRFRRPAGPVRRTAPLPAAERESPIPTRRRRGRSQSRAD